VPILLDCDPGHDDAVAILLAAGNDAVDLRAITTVAGNCPLDLATRNARRVAALAGLDVPIAAGAAGPRVGELVTAPDIHGETGLDGHDLTEEAPLDDRSALELMSAVLEAADEPITLVPTGPLTNVAALLEARPDLHDKIREIVIMGGSTLRGNTTPAAEFNIWVDPEAAARVFASDVDTTMVGLDVTHRALMTPAHADQLKASGRIGGVVAELFAFYNRFHSRVYDLPGSPVHDALAVAHVIRADLLTTKHCHVAVDCASELCRGRTVVDLWSVTGNETNAHVATEVQGTAFIDLLVERIGSLG